MSLLGRIPRSPKVSNGVSAQPLAVRAPQSAVLQELMDLQGTQEAIDESNWFAPEKQLYVYRLYMSLDRGALRSRQAWIQMRPACPGVRIPVP